MITVSPSKTKCQCRCCKCYSNPYDNFTTLYRIHLIFIDMISSNYKIEHVSDVLVLHSHTLSITTLGTGYMRLVTLIFNSSTHRIITSLWSHAAKLWVLIWKFQGHSSYPQKFRPSGYMIVSAYTLIKWWIWEYKCISYQLDTIP